MKNGNRFLQHSSGRESSRHDDYRSAAKREARRRGAGRRWRLGPQRRRSGRAIRGHRDAHLGILYQSWRWVTQHTWSVYLIKGRMHACMHACVIHCADSSCGRNPRSIDRSSIDDSRFDLRSQFPEISRISAWFAAAPGGRNIVVFLESFVFGKSMPSS